GLQIIINSKFRNMKKTLVVLALIMTYGMSVAIAGETICDDKKAKVSAVVLASADVSDDGKTANAVKTDGCSDVKATAVVAKADGCTGVKATAVAAKADGCSGVKATN